MSLNEFGEDGLQNMDFGNEFGNGGQDSFTLDLETADTPPTDTSTNPLGLSDKDLQLQYDHVYPSSSTTEHKEQAHQESSRPESPADEDEPEEPATPAVPNADVLFGSDHSDIDDDGLPTEHATGSGPEELEKTDEAATSVLEQHPDEDNLSEGGGSIKSEPGEDKISDFDIMMQKKSEERRRAFKRRKRGQDVDLINDHDDKIKVLIDEMKEAAEADRRANQRGECAINKLTMLSRIMNLLRKHDLQTALLDLGILSALADWLAPLPDGNLPHLKIRESILKVLQEMSSVTPEQLKNSGIGKAVMLLFKHPRELKENRAAAGKLIQEWSRPIFGTSANYRSLSREEREERDLELLNVKRRQSSDARASGAKSTPGQKRRGGDDSDEEEEDEEDNHNQSYRARVPQPSLRDYVIRPKSQISMEPNESRRSSGGKPQNRFAKKIRGLQEQQRIGSKSKNKHISLEGRRL